MSRLVVAIFIAAFACGTASAQDLLIRDATVHTAGARGTLEHADVLVRGGRIAAVGRKLLVPNGATVVEARGRPLTPGLFAGISDIGLEEVSAVDTTVDSAQSMGGNGEAPQMRPEFDVTVAFNPDSILLPVARLDGITFAALPAVSTEGGSLLAGQGGVMRLDGRSDGPLGGRQLYISFGGGADSLGGGSRAAQLMLLE
ncbi:MAG: amidohydrolase family protein, partial [Arenimonas sp.]